MNNLILREIQTHKWFWENEKLRYIRVFQVAGFNAPLGWIVCEILSRAARQWAISSIANISKMWHTLMLHFGWPYLTYESAESLYILSYLFSELATECQWTCSNTRKIIAAIIKLTDKYVCLHIIEHRCFIPRTYLLNLIWLKIRQ